MNNTADQLEKAEAILHHNAEQSPDASTTARLHARGDQVTAQAQDIAGRADRLRAEQPAQQPDPTSSGAPG